MALVLALQRNGRATFVELGAQVGLSESATYRRVRSLERKGLIASYTAVVDHELAGYSVCARFELMLDREDGGTLSDFENWVADNDSVRECFRISGDYLYSVTAIFTKNSDVSDFLDLICERFPSITRTRRVVLLKVIKSHHSAPIRVRPDR